QYAMQSEENTEDVGVDSQLLLHDRHGHGEILPDEIKRRVAQGGPEENSRAKVGELLADFVRVRDSGRRRRRTQPAGKPAGGVGRGAGRGVHIVPWGREMLRPKWP